MLSTRQVLLHRITQERSVLFHTIAFMPDEQLVGAPVLGEWTAKDVLGHVAAWEAEMTRGIEQFLRGERPALLDIADCDAWNAEQAGVRRERTLDDVKREMVDTRRRLLDLVAQLPNDAFHRPGPAPDRRPFVPLMLNGVADHDRQHWANLMAHKEQWIARQRAAVA
jgi:hypothetical protein